MPTTVGKLVALKPPLNSIWRKSDSTVISGSLQPRVIHATGDHLLGWLVLTESNGTKVPLTLYQKIGDRPSPVRTMNIPVFPVFSLVKSQFGLFSAPPMDPQLAPLFRALNIPPVEIEQHNEALHDMKSFFVEMMGKWFVLNPRNKEVIENLYTTISLDVMAYLENPTSPRLPRFRTGPSWS